jgi:putative ABC transport system permease protein
MGTGLRKLGRRVKFLFRQRRREDDLAAELALHRALKQEELAARGLTPEDVAAATWRSLGNDALAMNQARDVWIWPWLQDISQDVRFAFRMLAKDRRFTIAAVVALALGVGLNNSVFAIIDITLIRDVPFQRGDRLVRIQSVDARGEDLGISRADLQNLQQFTSGFEGLAAEAPGVMSVSDDWQPAERVPGAFVSSNSFSVLRVAPTLGRDFRPEDDRLGAPGVALIGHTLWMNRYRGDPAIVGQTIKINSIPITVIGVMPVRFNYPFFAGIWQPLTHAPSLVAGDPRRGNLGMIGRLAGSASRAQAQADLDVVAARLAVDNRDTNKEVRFRVADMKEDVQRQAWPMLLTMMGAVGIVMLIACANLANLLLARAATRSREFAIRSSLGAPRWRLVRQLLIECAMLAVGGGVVGLALSYYGIREIAVAFAPIHIGEPPSTSSLPYWLDVSLNGSAYLFVGLLCLFATLAFGLVPALRISRADPHETLKSSQVVGHAGTRRWTAGLMVTELALTLILLTAAALLWQNFISLYRADTVIDPTGIVTMELSLPGPRYATPDQRRHFFETLEQRLNAKPSVGDITLASQSPAQRGAPRQLTLEGRPSPPDAKLPLVAASYVAPRYFEMLGLALLRGRALTADDSRPGAESVVVNQRFADLYFPNGEALGQRLRLTAAAPPSTSPWLMVVGIVPTLPRHYPGPQDAPAAYVYVPLSLDPAQRSAAIIVRAGDGGIGAVAPALREEVRALDPDLPLYNIARLEDVIAASRIPVRTVGTWFGALAIIALLVASVGLFAVTAHGVAQRSQEIGLRITLGAQRRQVIWLFLRQTLLQLAAGLVLGLAGALSVGQLLQSYLRQTSPRDPITMTLVVVFLTISATAAALLPARRAAQIDPAVTLKEN